MENVQKPKVGAGILTMSIIQLVIYGFGLIGSIRNITNLDAVNAQLKAVGFPETTMSAIIIGLVFTVIIVIGIILILMKKELGIYIYFIAIVASIVYAIVSSGFSPWMLLNLIMPVLTGIFIWNKKEIFVVEVKA